MNDEIKARLVAHIVSELSAPTPDQVAQWSIEFTRWFARVAKTPSIDINLQQSHSWNGYYRRCTEQATEIAALKLDIANALEALTQAKSEIAEIMPLAKFCARAIKAKSVTELPRLATECGIYYQTDTGFALLSEIEATIEQLLKD
jgi:hypothetical protein